MEVSLWYILRVLTFDTAASGDHTIYNVALQPADICWRSGVFPFWLTTVNHPFTYTAWLLIWQRLANSVQKPAACSHSRVPGLTQKSWLLLSKHALIGIFVILISWAETTHAINWGSKNALKTVALKTHAINCGSKSVAVVLFRLRRENMPLSAS